MTTPRIQRELEAAELAQAAFTAQRSEHTAQAVQTAAELVLPAPPSEVPDVVPPPAPAESKKDDTNFEHKYSVLQGMYKANVTRLNTQVAELHEQIQAMKKADPAEPAQLDPKDVDKFGADLIEMVKRYAEGQQEANEARFAALEQKVGIVVSETVATNQRSFYERLERMVPDVDAINQDPRWLAWLGEADLMSGKPRQAALDDAHGKGDVQRVATIFQTFVATLQPAVRDASPLASQVVPQGAGQVQLPAPAAKPIISTAAINGFYRDVSRGVYDGKEAEANRLEAEINLAVAEGRVR